MRTMSAGFGAVTLLVVCLVTPPTASHPERQGFRARLHHLASQHRWLQPVQRLRPNGSGDFAGGDTRLHDADLDRFARLDRPPRATEFEPGGRGRLVRSRARRPGLSLGGDRRAVRPCSGSRLGPELGGRNSLRQMGPFAAGLPGDGVLAGCDSVLRHRRGSPCIRRQADSTTPASDRCLLQRSSALPAAVSRMLCGLRSCGDCRSNGVTRNSRHPGGRRSVHVAILGERPTTADMVGFALIFAASPACCSPPRAVQRKPPADLWRFANGRPSAPSISVSRF